MHYQHRSGLQSRTRNNDNTRWAVNETDGLPISVWFLIIGVLILLALYGAAVA